MARYTNLKVVKTISFPLTSGDVVAQGDLVVGDPATGKLVAAAEADETMKPIGFSTVDATGDGTTEIEVELFAPVNAYRFTNSGTNAVSLLFSTCYSEGPGTVGDDGTSLPAVGMVLDVDSTLGVLVAPSLI